MTKTKPMPAAAPAAVPDPAPAPASSPPKAAAVTVIVTPPPELLKAATPAKPMRDALRELLAACPKDVATCAGISPAGLERYMKARHVAEAVLAAEG